jgi:hypothetical protein
MPISPKQRARVLAGIAAGRLRLDAPTRMYAGYGTGRACEGCGDSIDRTQIEYEAVYADGPDYRLHLGCAGALGRRTPSA